MDINSLAATIAGTQVAQNSLDISIAVQRQQAEAAQAVAQVIVQATEQVVSASKVDIQT